jgi:hypothetical protein
MFPTFKHLAALLIIAAGAAAAQDNPVVVELFTSQGCSSCPPADDMFTELAAVDGVLALSLHVDYWDYIGWADSFADPAFTARQQDYAIAAGARTVYTPQFIIGGHDAVVGADGMAVMEYVRKHAGLPAVVDLDVRLTDGRLIVTAERTGPAMPLVVQLVRYRPEATVEITAGENAGHTISYANIVTDWQVVGRWEGAAPFRSETMIEGPERTVVILQEPGPGLIRAAALAE